MGRPRLLGTMARTAVVAGTATAVTGGMMRRAQRREIEHQHAVSLQQAEEPSAVQAQNRTVSKENITDKLQELASLRASGALTDDEFAAAKQWLLSE